MNRIIAATGGTNTNYDVSDITYDKNGNIQMLARNGFQGGSNFTNMDVLDYDYDNGNKLTKVTDNGNDGYGFKDGTNTNDDFEYDENGNLEIDRNKGITGVTYNHLNLPEQVNFGSDNIKYVYDAMGAKLKRTANTGTETLYAGNFIYEGTVGNAQLQFFPHAEGYVTPDGSGWRYVYQYRDHLDNIRLSYTEAPGGGLEIVEDNAYYPFGLKMLGFNGNVSPLGNDVAQRWKFGGKELNGTFNIDTYDFGARNYDPAIGRWMNIDPLAEQMRRHSPYNYAFDNPIYFTDPDGMMPQGPCGDKPCPDEQEQIPPDAERAKNKIDNLLANIVKGIDEGLDKLGNLFSSDSNESSESDEGGFTNDGLTIYGEGGDPEAGDGIVTGDDRGDGNSITAGAADINPLNAVLSMGIEALEGDSNVTQFDVDESDGAVIIEFSSNSGDDNVIHVTGSENRQTASRDSAEIMNTTQKKKFRTLSTFGKDSIRVIDREKKR